MFNVLISDLCTIHGLAPSFFLILPTWITFPLSSETGHSGCLSSLCPTHYRSEISVLCAIPGFPKLFLKAFLNETLATQMFICVHYVDTKNLLFCISKA